MKMKERADTMEHSAQTNMNTTGAKVKEILEVLNEAIKESKSVDQVNSLTNDILEISAQTNQPEPERLAEDLGWWQMKSVSLQIPAGKRQIIFRKSTA